jgi:hypothetical protein
VGAKQPELKALYPVSSRAKAKIGETFASTPSLCGMVLGHRGDFTFSQCKLFCMKGGAFWCYYSSLMYALDMYIFHKYMNKNNNLHEKLFSKMMKSTFS